MGLAKRQLEEEEARGWRSSGDRYVCAECFVDPALREFASAHAEADTCDFCGARRSGQPIAAPVDLLVELIAESLQAEWDNPDNVGVPYDSGEGGYQGRVYDTWDLLWGLEPVENEAARQAVIDALPDQLWCERDFWRLARHEVLTASWQRFREIVTHRTRYLFLAAPRPDANLEDSELIAPHKMLDAIATTIDEANLTRALPAGSVWWRARAHQPGTPPPPTAAELGTAPVEKTRSNRMSSSGIAMFYGAAEQRTAIEEVGGTSHDRNVTVGGFELARPMMVLDLTQLQEVPSLFDRDRRHLRSALRFLYEFSQDVSKPAQPDNREHLEYVPTQIVTEYFRHIYRTPEDEQIMGLLYRSSRLGGGTCCVLFVEAEGCVEPSPGWQAKSDHWLGLQLNSVATVGP